LQIKAISKNDLLLEDILVKTNLVKEENDDSCFS